MSSSDTGEEADAVHRRIMDIKTKKPRLTEVDDGRKSQVKIDVDHVTTTAVGAGTRVAEPPLKRDGQSSKEKFGFDLTFFRRFYRLHGLLFLSFTSLSTFLFSFLLAICLLQEYIVYRVGLMASGFYKSLADRDLPAFWAQVWYSLAIILAIAFTKSMNQYIQKVLTVTWRQLLSKAIHRIYFAEIHYYQLNVLDKSIDNPDQRMTQDVDKFCITYCELLPKLMISPFVIGYYCYQAYERSGWQGPLGCFGFFIVATMINKLLMTPIVQYVVKQEKCEGDFRFIHTLVRVNSESIAFHNAANVEGTKANNSLDKLLRTQHRLYCRQLLLNFSINLFDYLGSIFSYLMLAIPIFSGRYDDLTPAELSALISQNAFVLIYLIYTFTSLVDTSTKFTDIAGVAHRIAQLIERLNVLGDFWKDLFPEDTDPKTASSIQLYEEWTKRRSNSNSITGNGSGSLTKMYHDKTGEDSFELLPAWTLKSVTFCAPMSIVPLVSNLSLTLYVGQSVLIVGNSSAGKSSLLRLLRGLWPHNEGTLQRHFPPGPRVVYYFPQKPYLTFGSLRDQICYPLKSTGSNTQEDSSIIHYFGLLKLKSLLERVGGLDVPVSWNLFDSLSPGEMQRLCFIRVFYHRPLIAVLDESTSALPCEMEDLIYSECKRLGITTISVGHRASLRKYHHKLLTLDSKGGWSLENLERLKAPSPLPSTTCREQSNSRIVP